MVVLAYIMEALITEVTTALTTIIHTIHIIIQVTIMDMVHITVDMVHIMEAITHMGKEVQEVENIMDRVEALLLMCQTNLLEVHLRVGKRRKLPEPELMVKKIPGLMLVLQPIDQIIMYQREITSLHKVRILHPKIK